jgi:hypothetical protein
MSDLPDGATGRIPYVLLQRPNAGRKKEEPDMTWITVATPPFESVEQFDKIAGDQPTPPHGMEARYVGTADDGRLRFITLWASKADADRFFAHTLGPALAKSLGPEPTGAPQVIGIDVARSYVRQPAG